MYEHQIMASLVSWLARLLVGFAHRHLQVLVLSKCLSTSSSMNVRPKDHSCRLHHCPCPPAHHLGRFVFGLVCCAHPLSFLERFIDEYCQISFSAI